MSDRQSEIEIREDILGNGREGLRWGVTVRVM